MFKIFTVQDKKLSIQLMITQKLYLKLFIKQKQMKQNREQWELKH